MEATLTPTRAASSRWVSPVRPRSWRTRPRKLSRVQSSAGGTLSPLHSQNPTIIDGAHRWHTHHQCSSPPDRSAGVLTEDREPEYADDIRRTRSKAVAESRPGRLRGPRPTEARRAGRQTDG